MKCEITKDLPAIGGEVWISITHNGYQWSTIRLKSVDEVRQLRDECTQYLEEVENE